MSGVPDYTVGATLYHHFSTRAFATGIPTTLIGSPVAEAYEDASATGITDGVSLTIDHAETGHHLLTVVATGGNGFETAKTYGVSLTAGTVGGVSVVGEVIFNFTLGRSAAAVDLANGTDGLGAIKTDTAAVKVATDKMVFSVANQLDTNPLSWNSVLLATTNPLPNAAAEAAGGLYTRGTGAGQINQASNGLVDVNTDRVNDSAIVPDTMKRLYADFIARGTADSGTTTTMVDAFLTQADGAWIGSTLIFASGTNNKRAALITGFDAASDTVTFVPALPDAVTTENYLIMPGGYAGVEAWRGTAVSALNDISVSDVLTTQMTEAYAANGVAPTLAQALFALHQMLMDFSISGTSITVEKLDGTTAFTVTLDDGTNPTSANRA